MLLFLIVYIISAFIFYVYYNFLLVLLILEFMMLSTLGIFYMVVSEMGGSYLVVYFLVFAVVEGVLGLSVLVSLLRFSGSDYLMVGSLVC